MREGAVAPVDPAVGCQRPRGNSAWSALRGPCPPASRRPRFPHSLSRWNWSKALSELQTKVMFSSDLTTGPPCHEGEGFGQTWKEQTLISEHKVTRVLIRGLNSEVSNKRSAAVRRPPTARRESPTGRDTQYRESFTQL